MRGLDKADILDHICDQSLAKADFKAYRKK